MVSLSPPKGWQLWDICLTSNNLPSLKERPSFQRDALDEPREEDGQPQHQRPQAPGKLVRHSQNGRIAENVFTLDMNHFLDLSPSANLAHGFVVESSADSALCRLVGVLYAHFDIGYRGRDFVAEEQGETTESTVILGLDAYLDRVVFEEHTFVAVAQSLEPLDTVSWSPSRQDGQLTFSIFGAAVRGASKEGATPPRVA